jgi:outer membrane biosynthesis protein TonB
MKNKLLISMALLAAGIAAASCEKTPSGESGADAPNQSGSTTSERQDQSAGRAARASNEQQSEQRRHEKEAQDRNAGDRQNQSNSSQSQEQPDQKSAQAQDKNNKAKDGEAQQSEPTQQDRANAQSPSSAQSDQPALQRGQAQPSQPQQNISVFDGRACQRLGKLSRTSLCRTSRPVSERPVGQCISARSKFGRRRWP